MHNGFAYNAPKGGGWEYPGFWAVALLVQALLGDGAFALVKTPLPATLARIEHGRNT